MLPKDRAGQGRHGLAVFQLMEQIIAFLMLYFFKKLRKHEVLQHTWCFSGLAKYGTPFNSS